MQSSIQAHAPGTVAQFLSISCVTSYVDALQCQIRMRLMNFSLLFNTYISSINSKKVQNIPNSFIVKSWTIFVLAVFNWIAFYKNFDCQYIGQITVSLPYNCYVISEAGIVATSHLQYASHLTDLVLPATRFRILIHHFTIGVNVVFSWNNSSVKSRANCSTGVSL